MGLGNEPVEDRLGRFAHTTYCHEVKEFADALKYLQEDMRNARFARGSVLVAKEAGSIVVEDPGLHDLEAIAYAARGLEDIVRVALGNAKCDTSGY